MRRPFFIPAGVALAALVAVVAFLLWPAALPRAIVSASQLTGVPLIARGRYLATAADCVACHTAPGGASFAGGRAFKLPFGTIYWPNITPDRDTGIGGWSNAEFVRALQRGIGRRGENLYPALPYTAYALASTDDVLAIRAYLATLTPVHAASPKNRLAFLFNQRVAMRAWNLLFLPGRPMESDRTHDAAWNRGKYLADALGRCGECHTPRDMMMGLDQGERYAGAVRVGWRAYNLTSDRRHGLGNWTDAALTHYLSTGRAQGHGPASGPMAEVVENSLSHLDAGDIAAIVHYFRSVPAQSGGPAMAGDASPAPIDSFGEHLFVQACAGCHLPDGEGRQSPWAALAGSHSTADSAATNLLEILANGSSIMTGQGPMFMHGFTAAYSDDELAAVANYTIQQFGRHPGHVTPEQIRHGRGDVPASPGS